MRIAAAARKGEFVAAARSAHAVVRDICGVARAVEFGHLVESLRAQMPSHPDRLLHATRRAPGAAGWLCGLIAGVLSRGDGGLFGPLSRTAHPGYCANKRCRRTALLTMGQMLQRVPFTRHRCGPCRLRAAALRQRETVLKIVWKLFAVFTAIVLVLIAWGIYLEWNVKRWDARIDALCAANGGRDVATRVYETALAPETKEYFADTKPIRSLHIPSRYPGQSLGPNFPFVMETERLEVLNEQNPSVYRYVVRVVRVADKKVLGEQVRYVRAGGGIPLPDPSTPHGCPKDPRYPELTTSVFLNHPRRSESISK